MASIIVSGFLLDQISELGLQLCLEVDGTLRCLTNVKDLFIERYVICED